MTEHDNKKKRKRKSKLKRRKKVSIFRQVAGTAGGDQFSSATIYKTVRGGREKTLTLTI
jgi:hypothetical protein